MKAGQLPNLILLAGVSILTSCRYAAESRSTIVLDDSLEHSRDISVDFESAFALEPTCAGLKLLLRNSPGFQYPSTPYWTLDIFNSPGSRTDMSPPVRWTIAHGGGNAEGYATGSDASPVDAVKHVCFIAKQKGGEVR